MQPLTLMLEFGGPFVLPLAQFLHRVRINVVRNPDRNRDMKRHGLFLWAREASIGGAVRFGFWSCGVAD
jgi:hypothetical protein